MILEFLESVKVESVNSALNFVRKLRFSSIVHLTSTTNCFNLVMIE